MPTLLIVLLIVIALFVAGGFVVSTLLTLVWWALIGLVIGALARLVLPGRQPIGLARTALGGIGGALLGGIIANAAELGGLVQFLIAVAVAAVFVALLAGAERRASAPAVARR